jgi:hypothetical protein
VPLLIGGWPASAEAFFVDIEVSIVWTNPQSFPNTFSGDSFFTAGDFCPTDPTAFCGIPFGAHTYTDVPVEPADPIDIFFPPDPILPNDTIVWQFAGFIHAGPETYLPTFAFPSSPVLPAAPPTSDPLILIGVHLMPGFAPIDVTGPIYAFDSWVQVGTYEIRVAPSAAPEPGSLLLVGIALGALVTLGGVKRRGSRA